jgi:hypothetical protein
MSQSALPSNGSKILSKSPLSPNEAKWTRLTKINWQDPSGHNRLWECAERSTRSKGGIDGRQLRPCVSLSGRNNCYFEGEGWAEDRLGKTVSPAV